MEAIVCERQIACLSPIDTVWDLISDTNQLNWAAGLAALELRPLDDKSSARYVARTRLGGFWVEYDEQPYEWVFHESLKVFRRMHNGPLHSLEMNYAVQTTAVGGTTVTLRMVLEPRSMWLVPIIQVRASMELRALASTIQRQDRAIAMGQAPLPPRHEPNVREDALKNALVKLKDESAPLLARLVGLLRVGNDLQVVRIRPFVLADAWKVPRLDLLLLCLHAVNAKLLGMRWDVVCPSCRTAATSSPSLRDITEHANCQFCDLKFTVSLEDGLELVFTPHDSIRRTQEQVYCIGGPARTPHVYSQAILPSHGIATLHAPDQPGRYRLFVRGGASAMLNVVAGGAEAVRFDTDALSGLTTTDVAPLGLVIVNNKDARGMHAKLERYDWAMQAATARDVVSIEAFKQMFEVPAFLASRASAASLLAK